VTGPPFELASLDMAGTTVDERGVVYDVLGAMVTDAVGRAVPADLLGKWKGTSKREAIAGLLTAMGDGPADVATVDKVFDGFVDRLTAAYRETPPVPLPGVPEALAALRAAGVKVALQTGYSAEIAGVILDGLGWTVGETLQDTVDALVTSDQVAASRPAPYLIFRCMESTGVLRTDRVLVAGDTPNDLGAGTNAGAAYVVGVLTGSFDATALGACRHTHILPSVAELPSLL
jgi:phosphonatase-like hydrolase